MKKFKAKNSDLRLVSPVSRHPILFPPVHRPIFQLTNKRALAGYLFPLGFASVNCISFGEDVIHNTSDLGGEQ